MDKQTVDELSKTVFVVWGYGNGIWDMNALGQGIRKTRLSACVVGDVVVDGREWAPVAPSTGQLRTGLTHLGSWQR